MACVLDDVQDTQIEIIEGDGNKHGHKYRCRVV